MPRRTAWEDTNMELSLGNGVTAGVGLHSASPVDTRGVTVTRFLGDLSVTSTTVAGAWGVQHLILGVGVLSQEAFLASTFPDPETDVDHPAGGWLYRNRIAVGQNGAGGGLAIARLTFDIRSARRLNEGELVLVLHNRAVDGTTFNMRVGGMLRTLFLLP